MSIRYRKNGSQKNKYKFVLSKLHGDIENLRRFLIPLQELLLYHITAVLIISTFELSPYRTFPTNMKDSYSLSGNIKEMTVNASKKQQFI